METMQADRPAAQRPQIQSSILQRIGRTPLLRLSRIVPADCARILIKVESENE